MYERTEQSEAESLHRLVKVLVDSAEAATLEAAFEAFAAYGVRIRLGSNLAQSAEIVALTVINAAARSFLGNVVVEGSIPETFTVQGFAGIRVREFLNWVGVGKVPFEKVETWPIISIGVIGPVSAGEIRVWSDGWAYGLGSTGEFTDQTFPPACVAAAGLAVNEAFSMLRKDNPYAGRRELALSLWDLSNPTDKGPTAEFRIPGLWLVGLGHLGQAYAWTLSFMLPDESALLILQDVDAISRSTLSTSLLSGERDVQVRKARVASRWLESRGFTTAIVERRFDEYQRNGVAEPKLALFGVDNTVARRAMESAGFDLIVDAGLGSGYSDFRTLRVRTFPGPSQASVLWASDAMTQELDTPAYQAMRAEGMDPCGVTTLATRAVGAPFVGCVAAGYSLSEICRRQLGGIRHSFVDCNLKDISKIDFEIM